MEKLNSNSLRKACDTKLFDFESTKEIEELITILGQERLTSALEFGTKMDQKGYNIFALGPNETDKQGYIREFLENESKNQDAPDDLCYVNNFDDRYKPSSMFLPNGRGKDLKKKMDKLIEDLPPTLTAAFESEEYENRRQALQDKVQDEQDKSLEDIKNKAREKGLALLRTPAGFSFAPLKEGGNQDLMSEEDVRNLSAEKREELEEKTKELQSELQELIRKMPATKRQMRKQKKQLDKEIATYAIKDLFEEIRDDFSDLDNVLDFLDNVETDVVENVQAIMSNQGGQQQNQLAQMMGGGQQMQMGGLSGGSSNPVLDRYRVNIIVDHSETDGAPVIYEDNPSYKNLIGRVEYKSKMGALTTNFNLIKAGALHKANGGYLILDARQVLLEPFAWEGLKRVLKSGNLKIESLGESYSMISTVSLEPDPIDVDVKIVLMGQRILYYLLCEYDPDFQKLFKVEADFEDEIDRSDENQVNFTKMIAGLAKENDLRSFNRDAVARIIEQSSRMVSDNEKLSTKTDEIQDLLMEADHWAKENKHDIVQYEDVEEAVEQKIYRSSRIRDKVHEVIDRNTIFIDTEGEAIGQVNGLSVAKIGNLMFGRPNRITAKVQIGKGEIINIEREVDMSGPIHSKGVLILKGFLGERYAKTSPLSMNASLVFEQSYSNIDGDSASAAELFALLSAIGDIPLKQSFSVTGSINQHGQIQPIGGVNEKIEGFFDICKKRGLTGDQGVLIPKANEKNLMLRTDILEAVENDKFHIYSIEHVDEGLKFLTGLDVGLEQEDGTFPEDTLNHKVTLNLKQLADKRKAFATPENGRK
ncbi:Lon protease family protein [Rhodohalobacter sulfatireducens]|uniref:endopeptidase La n=1 Tax=Rhodohalobacter sulfatireducens TaxID=2911366 RepID=A0ABS9KIE6_9BACT|nr:AAA family ATPase [Rhodohalobacter sulfatireducens]